ncbi:hypothetical protein A7982_13064 [Minicystis rosea]|nr:hypothetical protein A7982_13064 [Minicystis rosea]
MTVATSVVRHGAGSSRITMSVAILPDTRSALPHSPAKRASASREHGLTRIMGGPLVIGRTGAPPAASDTRGLDADRGYAGLRDAQLGWAYLIPPHGRASMFFPQEGRCSVRGGAWS